MKVNIFKLLSFGLIFLFLQYVQGGNRANHMVIIKIIRKNEISIQKANSRIDMTSRNTDEYSKINDDCSHCHLKWTTDHCNKKITVSYDQRLSRQLGIRLEDHDNGCMINNIPSIFENQEIVTLQSDSEGQIDLNYIINCQELSTIKNNNDSVLYTITDK